MVYYFMVFQDLVQQPILEKCHWTGYSELKMKRLSENQTEHELPF